MSTSAPSEQDFEIAADSELRALRLAFDQLDLEDVEADLENGILTITIGDDTEYVINSHRAARQIWMAAERTAWHFDRNASGKWVASKTGDELWAALEAALTRKLGSGVALPRG